MQFRYIKVSCWNRSSMLKIMEWMESVDDFVWRRLVAIDWFQIYPRSLTRWMYSIRAWLSKGRAKWYISWACNPVFFCHVKALAADKSDKGVLPPHFMNIIPWNLINPNPWREGNLLWSLFTSPSTYGSLSLTFQTRAYRLCAEVLISCRTPDAIMFYIHLAIFSCRKGRSILLLKRLGKVQHPCHLFSWRGIMMDKGWTDIRQIN